MAVPKISEREPLVEAGFFLYLFCLFITYPQSLVERDQLPREFAGAELDPLGPLGFDLAQHRETLRLSVVGIRSKALRPFGLQI